MTVDVFDNADAAAEAAARLIAADAWAAVAARGRFVIAVSGGTTPWLMLRLLASRPVPWQETTVVQVDERVAPAGDPARNLTHLFESLLMVTSALKGAPMRREQIVAMPVESPNLTAAATQYAATLASLCGTPPVLDLVHLGLGPDGHTASLIPGDPVLDDRDADVAISGPYQGHMRMTLTYPMLDRARRIVWLVTGADKAPVLPRLIAHDPGIPAGRVRSDKAIVFADAAAAAQLR